MASERSSAAHVFFDGLNISKDKVAAIRAMIRSKPPTFETDHLDFKCCVDPRTPAEWLPDQQIKKIWSEAVGSFANTGGGNLVWGIDCRKTKDDATLKDVDAAVQDILVPRVYAFQSRLKELLKTANDPPVGGVEFLPVIAGGDDGFLVCLIPPSDRTPHDCQYVTNKPYMMRSGDNFAQIPPVMLRRMFYPQSAPYLMFAAAGSIEWNRSSGNATIRLEVTLMNVGSGTAKDLYIIVEDATEDKPSTLVPGSVNKNEWRQTTPAVAGGLGFHALESLHPMQLSKLYTMTWRREADGKVAVMQIGNDVVEANIPSRIVTLTAYAENMEPQNRTLTVTAADLLKGESVVNKEE